MRSTLAIEFGASVRYKCRMRRFSTMLMLGFTICLTTVGCVGPGKVRMEVIGPDQLVAGDILSLDVRLVCNESPAVLPRIRTYTVTIMGPNEVDRAFQRPVVPGCGLEYSSGVASFWWIYPVTFLDVADTLNRFEHLDTSDTREVNLSIQLSENWRQQCGILWETQKVEWPAGDYTAHVAMNKQSGTVNSIKLPPPAGWMLPTVKAEHTFSVVDSEQHARAR